MWKAGIRGMVMEIGCALHGFRVRLTPSGTGRAPDLINWAPRDYGNRVGIFRIMEVLARHGIRGTVALNSEVCDDYPPVVEDAVRLGWEFMGHNQSNSRYLHLMSPEEERHVVFETFERIDQATGTRPKGWLSSGSPGELADARRPRGRWSTLCRRLGE